MPEDALPIYTPFNRRKPVAWIQPRVEAGVANLVLRSRMEGPLAFEIEGLALADAAGEIGAGARLDTRCRLKGGGRVVLLRRELTSPPNGALRVRGSVRAIPIEDPGRAMYREWAWLRRPREVQAIDRELAALTALPECAEQSVGGLVD